MNDKYMNNAYKEATKAYDKGEIPVGAVIVKDGKIIAKGYNRKENKKSVLEHAEIIAINKASKKLGNWRLNGCDIYITLEPCPMCASAIKQARISNIYYAMESTSVENSEIVKMIVNSVDGNVIVNMNKVECVQYNSLLKDFFLKKRNK